MAYNHNRAGQLACLTAVERTMDDLERAIIISGVGAPQFENARLCLTALRQVTQDMRMPIGEAPKINNEDRDRARGVMRPPKYRGD